MPPGPVSTVATPVYEPPPGRAANTDTVAFACLVDTVPRSISRRPKTTVEPAAEIETVGATVVNAVSAPKTVPELLAATRRR